MEFYLSNTQFYLNNNKKTLKFTFKLNYLMCDILAEYSHNDISFDIFISNI